LYHQQLQKNNSLFSSTQDVTMSTMSLNSSSRHTTGDPLNSLSATPPTRGAAPALLYPIDAESMAGASSSAASASTFNNSTGSAMSDGAMSFIRTVQRVKSLNRRDKMKKLKQKSESHLLVARLVKQSSSLLQQPHDVRRLSSMSDGDSKKNKRVEFREGISEFEGTPLLAQQQQDDLMQIQEEGHCGGRGTGGDGYEDEDDGFGNLKEQMGAALLDGDEGKKDADHRTIAWALYDIVFGKGIISLMLAAAPFAILAYYQDWSASWQFWLNFCVLIPLAAILGHFTEELALHTNQTIGGLINATFGNAVEVVVGIQALLQDEIRVVQASMIGSIFSNLLLVLGCCFFFGGLYHKEQTFNATAASANMGLLALSGIALVLPTPFAEYYEINDEHVLTVSRTAAMFLIFMYIQLLIFQLKTHVHVFEDGGDDGAELAAIPFSVALVGLSLVTLSVTIFSNYLVQSIEGYTTDSGISRTFVGIILLPIVGNAVEHVAAVTVAIKDKMDLSMGIAVGSCAQISLFVCPAMVLIGWALDKDMTLNFPHFEVILFVMSIFTVSISLSNPKCNWLEGSLFVTIYLLIAIGFWFEKVKNY
jgi:Ca2+:H+ antiporter